MAFEQRENSGSLFKNERKERDTHADYTGTCLIGGVEYYMNAWLKEGKKGKFFSFSFKPKGETGKRAVEEAKKPLAGHWIDDPGKRAVTGDFIDDDLSDLPF
jgi:hypothetical protein